MYVVVGHNLIRRSLHARYQRSGDSRSGGNRVSIRGQAPLDGKDPSPNVVRMARQVKGREHRLLPFLDEDSARVRRRERRSGRLVVEESGGYTDLSVLR